MCIYEAASVSGGSWLYKITPQVSAHLCVRLRDCRYVLSSAKTRACFMPALILEGKKKARRLITYGAVFLLLDTNRNNVYKNALQMA
jgi:hypothetical protein